VISSLALAVLAGLGFASLKKRSDTRFACALCLVVLDYLWLPYPLRDDPLSPLYARLHAEAAPGAVLDLPFTDGASSVQNMRAQTVHERPIAGGYVSVLPEAPLLAIRGDVALSDLFGLEPQLRSPIDRGHLASLGFSVAILHKDRRQAFARQKRQSLDPGDLFGGKIASRLGGMSEAKFRELRRSLEEACGKPILEDEQVAVFALAHRP
jgi:hypothetical protein